MYYNLLHITSDAGIRNEPLINLQDDLQGNVIKRFDLPATVHVVSQAAEIDTPLMYVFDDLQREPQYKDMYKSEF